MALIIEPDSTRKTPMMAIRPFAASLLLAAACGLTASASASVDTSPKPGGVYRLKPGTYVAESASCEAPAEADLRSYDGRGIAAAHSRACRARVLARKGSRYSVEQSCIEAGTGHGRRHTERQKIMVNSALSFTQTVEGRSATYRYCPVYMLPRGLRD
jgi:hypothetical protein